MGFSFGSSGSKSFGSSLDFSFGRSGSRGESLDRANSNAVSGGTSSQSIAFEPLLSQLFSTATTRAMSAGPSPAAMLFSGGLDFLSRLSGNAGTEALARRVTGPNDALQANLDALRENLGRLFSEEINPAITNEAIAGGTLGGGRQGVAQGQGIRAIAEQFTQGAASLISTDQAQRDEAASTLGSLLAEGSRIGLENLSGLLNIGVEGQTNLAPLSALAQILGAPTVLTESQDFSRAISESLGMSLEESFGEDFSFGQSQTSSKSRGFNLGFG